MERRDGDAKATLHAQEGGSPVPVNRLANNQELLWVAAFCLVSLVAIGVGYFVVHGDAGIPAVLILMAGVLTGTLLLTSDRSRWILFCIGIATIALGHRSVYIGKATYLVPLEIIIGLLFLFSLATIGVEKDVSRPHMPWALTIVTIWCTLHGAISFFAGENWDSILAWASTMVLGFPTLWVVGRYVRTSRHLDSIWLIMLGVSCYMSILAVLEYTSPGVIQSVPWLFSTQGAIAQDGFFRAAFSFWGYPAAAIIVTWGMLIAYAQLFSRKSTSYKVFLLFVFVMGLIAVFISGQRGSWVGVSLGLFFLSLHFGAKGILGAGVLALVGTIVSTTELIPSSFWARLDTVSQILDPNQARDTSIGQRGARWDWGVTSTMQYPLFGRGYGHWLTHNAFLEISSTVGLVPAISFAVFIVQLIMRIAKVAFGGRTDEERQNGRIMMALSITWVIQMNIEAVFQTPPFAAAHWALIAVAWYLPTLTYCTKKSNRHVDTTLGRE